MASASVALLVADLAAKINPFNKDGVKITEANIASVDGSRYSVERRLRIYNDARTILSTILVDSLERVELAAKVPGATVLEPISFVGGIADKPASYVVPYSLVDAVGDPIRIVQPSQADLIRDLETQGRRFVVEYGDRFASLRQDTFIPDGDYSITYFSLPIYSVVDLDGSMQESFDLRWHPLILEIGQALSTEYGTVNLGSVLKRFYGAVGQAAGAQNGT